MRLLQARCCLRGSRFTTYLPSAWKPLIVTRLTVVETKERPHADTFLLFCRCLGIQPPPPFRYRRECAPHICQTIRRGANLCIATADAINRKTPKGCALCLGRTLNNLKLVSGVCDIFSQKNMRSNCFLSFEMSLIWRYVLTVLWSSNRGPLFREMDRSCALADLFKGIVLLN